MFLGALSVLAQLLLGAHGSSETVQLLKKKVAGMSSGSRGQTFHSLLAGDYKATESRDEKYRTP